MFDSMHGPWCSREITRANGQTVRARVIEDATASWHAHEESDEVFLVVTGILHVDTERGTETAHPGGLIVIPRGLRHRARVVGRVELLVIDAL